MDFILPELTPTGYHTFKVVKNVAKRLWIKGVSKTIVAFLGLNFLFPLHAFPEANRLKHFPSKVELDDIVHVPTGIKVQFSDLNPFFDCARILYVGEIHANMAAHQVQLKVLKACFEKFGERLAIGMEMFTSPYQPVLDLWVAGKIDEKKFLEDVRWDKEWGYDYNLYRDILDFAREKKIPVIALNAPKDLLKMVREKGLKYLSYKERNLLPEIDTDVFFHKVYLRKAIGEHADVATDFERYHDIQSLWDEYMAQTITDYLSSLEGKDKKFLAFAGNGHIIYDLGIPKRAFRRDPSPYYTIYTAEFQAGRPTADEALFSPEIPLEPADFIWAIAVTKEHKKRIYLGIQLQTTGDNRLVIQEIVPKSPAEKAGLMVGDIVVTVDDKEMKSVMDLIHYLQTKQFGDICYVKINREGTMISYPITLFEIERE